MKERWKFKAFSAFIILIFDQDFYSRKNVFPPCPFCTFQPSKIVHRLNHMQTLQISNCLWFKNENYFALDCQWEKIRTISRPMFLNTFFCLWMMRISRNFSEWSVVCFLLKAMGPGRTRLEWLEFNTNFLFMKLCSKFQEP